MYLVFILSLNFLLIWANTCLPWEFKCFLTLGVSAIPCSTITLSSNACNIVGSFKHMQMSNYYF